MYLFTRQVTVSPARLRAGMAHAQDMLEFVNRKTKLQVSLFQVLQGAPLGTLTYAYRTESYAASVKAADKLMQSDKYMEKVERGAKFFVGNPEDRLASFIHTAGTVSGPPNAANIVSARVEVHRVREAIAWSVQLADSLFGSTSVPCAVLSSNVGPYGTISWINYGTSLEQLEEANSKTNSDLGFLQRLEGSQGMFVPGSATGTLSRRLG